MSFVTYGAVALYQSEDGCFCSSHLTFTKSSNLIITVTLEVHVLLILQMKKLKFKEAQGQLISAQSS